jgi:hypothetical protein
MVWDWKKAAAEARRRLGEAKHGGREAALREADTAVDVNTVRRAVLALDFLDELRKSDPMRGDLVAKASLSVVEIFSRWWEIDPAKAAVELDRWAAGDVTTRRLAASLKDSREEAAAVQPQFDGFHAFAEPTIRLRIAEEFGSEPKRLEEKRPPHQPPVDFRYVVKDRFTGRERVAAAIVVGPYQNHTIYRKRKHDWMLKALGLACFYDLVLVIVSESDVCDDYRTWLDLARTDAGWDGETASRQQSADQVGRLRVLLVS